MGNDIKEAIKMEETIRYFVAASYPFENADAWDCETKEEAIKLFEELKNRSLNPTTP